MKATNIKGKPYIEVNERVKYFREHYPDYKLTTQIIDNCETSKGMVCIFKAVITNKDGEIVSTGHAYEKENASFINKTSYLENCETSAVGRALGLFGIGIDTSIASFEEVANAMENQKNKADKITEHQEDFIKRACEDDTISIPELKAILQKYGVKKLDELTKEQATEIITGINAKRKAKGE